MASLEVNEAEALQGRVIIDDLNNLRRAGAEPFTTEALPHYAAWTRQDLVLVVSLLKSIATYTRYIVILLIIMTAVLLFRGLH